MTAPYSCRVVSTSSPDESRSERMTAFSPAVAFGTNTRSSPRAPTNAASAPRASAKEPVEPAAEELDGIPLELELELLVALEHRHGAGAEGAVVEMDDPGIEQVLHGPTRIRPCR